MRKVLNALANGVEMRLHVQYRLSEMAIERTMELARNLEIPEGEINLWAKERRSRVEMYNVNIMGLLDKLRKNAMARDILANFTLYRSDNNEGVN